MTDTTTATPRTWPKMEYLPLAALRPGHEAPDGSINARKYGRDDCADLLPTLRSHGVIVPLVVKHIDGHAYVAAGNRRLAGMREIVEEGRRGDIMIPTIQLGHGDPLEISMLENSLRRDLHPVDRFEVLDILVQAGATPDDIAARYLMKVTQVRQALGLAKLAPEIREAWRRGDISGRTAEKFALTSDHAVQVKLLKRLGKKIEPFTVARELGGGDVSVANALEFVGREAYEKAGHHVNETLFRNEHEDGVTVSDFGALRAMASEKIAAQCQELVDDGWSWALSGSEAPNDLYSWKRVYQGGNGKFATDLKAVAGCVVYVENGKFRVEKGFVKPGTTVSLPRGSTTPPEERKEREKKKAARAEAGPALSNALATRLSRQITLAVADVLVTHPALALHVAVAALACSDSPTNIDLTTPAADSEWRTVSARHENQFGKYLKLCAKKPQGDLIKLLAGWIGEAVDLTCFDAGAMPLAGPNEHHEGSGDLLAALPARAINKTLRARFDAADYFGSMAVDAAHAAIKECGGLTVTGKKEAIARAAADIARAKKWLPPEMRIPGAYDGPGMNRKAKR
jgi:ParB family transcriptional regulator, chromosome partitioning protein